MFLLSGQSQFASYLYVIMESKLSWEGEQRNKAKPIRYRQMKTAVARHYQQWFPGLAGASSQGKLGPLIHCRKEYQSEPNEAKLVSLCRRKMADRPKWAVAGQAPMSMRCSNFPLGPTWSPLGWLETANMEASGQWS